MTTAFVSSYFHYENGGEMNLNQIHMYEALYKSAKKYFLPNTDVEFIFITNTDTTFSNITNINFKLDNRIQSYQHILLMKLLCLKYLTKQYEYIFVSDGDQLWIDYINEDFLKNEFYIMEHYFKPSAQRILNEVTSVIKIDGLTEHEEWTMGNFFGGKSHVMMDLLRHSEEWYEEYSKTNSANLDFFAVYPDEVFIMKYMVEQNKNFTRLNTVTVPGISDVKYFCSDFQIDETLYPHINNAKVLHNTKKDVSTLNKITKYYGGE